MRLFLSALFVLFSQLAVAQTDVPGCTIEIACNYDPAATLNDGSCDFVSCLVLGCTDATACNFNPAATVNDGSCDYLSCLVPGCTLANACNFDPAAEVNDGSCEYTSCAGCTNEFADNYDATATVDDGSCNPIEGCTSPQACNFNENANQDDGSCDFVSCLATGCTVLEACNYDAEAQVNDGSCVFPEEGRDCAGNCLEDADGDNVCDGDEVPGCTSVTALNYNALATDDDGTCIEPVGGCTDPEACNYDELATNDDGSCEFTSCAGCLQESACNYDEDAIYADESCEFPPFGFDCDGNCLNDSDGDGVCDPFEVVGCQDMSACNFDPSATDSGQCNFASPNFDCDGNSLRPLFTSFPANVTVQGWQVPEVSEAIVEAIVSPFAPTFEATYNGNLCYDDAPAPTIVFEGEVKIDGVCEHDYTLFRSWTATDCSGYSRTREQIIIVVDTVAPELFVPENMTVLCEDVATADFGDAFGTDDCGDVTIEVVETIVEGDCPGNYNIVRTFNAMDPCLNTTTAQQTITVVDESAPTILALSDLVLDCSDELPTNLPEATDNCSQVEVTVSEAVIPGDCAQTFRVVRTFTATDECGNQSTSTQKVDVVDDSAPVVLAGWNGCEDPASCAIDINGLEGEVIPEASLELQDDCDDEPTFSSTDVVLSTSDALEVILREYTISDACGNTLTLQEQFNVTLINPGCTDSAACNYNGEANVDDGSCEFCSCGQNACGCLDAEACNYDSAADYDDGSCTYPEPGFDCDGVCFDVNANDICDFEESGCTDAAACNYDDVAQVDDGSCDYCCGYEVFTSTEAGYGVSIDLVQTHTSGALAGLSTYRVYITTPNNNDILTAVTGGDEFPLALHTTTSFYQNVFGGCLGTNISSAMMVVAPDAAYDSYVTIGATSSDDLAGGEAQLIPGAWIESFEAGNSITVDDNIGSGWFLVPPGGENGVSGDDNRILVAQLTTDGLISGSFRVQIFPEGDQVNDVRPDLTFEQQPLQAFACPIIEQGPVDAVVSCDDVPGIPGADAFEVSYANATAAALGCEGELSVSLVSDDITEGDCAGNYQIARTLEVENCAGGSAQYTYTLTVEDTTAPTFDSVPADYTIECSANMVMEDATASDNCGSVTVTSATETIAGNATGNYTLIRTFTATDDCGNSSSATQTITVEDTTAPEFTSVPADYTIECSDDLVLDDATAEDNCNGADIQVSSEIVEGNATGNYTVIRTFTATDDAGNSNTATQTITVEDTTAPEFTSVPADYTAECSDELVLEDALAQDNCNGAVITVISETIAGDAAGNYSLVRTFTATDDAGNSRTAVQTITVQDTTAPELTIPSDYSAECTDELVFDDATATDNCGEVTIDVAATEEAGACAGTKTITRTFTATDDAGNSSSATQTITVQDTTGPELTIPADYTAECDEELVLDEASATDNCTACNDNFEFTSSADGYGLSLELVASHEDGVLAGMRTYRVYLDVASATDQVTSFTGNDEFALALNTTTSFYQNGFGGATPNDITDGAIALVPELTYDSYVTVGLMGQPQGAEGSVELIPGTWADAFEAGQSFSINDGVGSGWYIVPPVAVNGQGGDDQRVLVAQLTTDGDISGQFRTQIFPEGDQINDVRADLTFTHSRACEGLTIEVTSEEAAGDCDGSYTLTRTFTATDACGNSTSATQTITVEDTTAPEFTSVPADYTVECSDEMPMDDATASDNCSEVSITVESETTMGDCAGNYTIIRTFTATDDCGNSTSATQTITVQDTTGPELSIPADYTSECDQELVLEEASATDNCTACNDNFDFTSTVDGYGLSLELVADHEEGELAGMSTYRVYLDVASSTDQVTSFTGNDEFSLALNTTTSFYQNALGGATPNDLSEGAIALVPELAYDSYVTVGLMGQPEGAEGSVELIPGSWADAFEAGQSFTINDGVGSGWYIVPPVAVNGQGGDDQRVLVAQLTTGGDISGQFRTQIFPEGDQINDVRADLTFTHSRACEGLTIEVTSEEAAGDCDGSYTLTRTFTATDACGNSTSATQSITVEDTTAPEFTSVPADYTVECSDEMPMEDATASDNCSEVSVTVESETIAGNAAGNYTIVRTFTATDACGNSSSASQTITVEDTTAPELSIPADYTAECSDELILDDATATDNCGEVTIEVSSEETAGDCDGSYTVTRTFTATDDAGNSSSASQTITVEDTTAPEFTSVPSDYTVECSDDMPMEDATASDNCSEVTITVSSDTTAGDAAGNYTIVRTFTATDDCGNSTSASQTITVEDTTAPELSIPADYTAECSDELILDDATATDNCGEVTIEVSSETTAGDCDGSYTVTRTFTATDDAGNSSSATQTITVEDTTAPEFTSVPADYTVECSDEMPMDDATASDNCSDVSITVESETMAGDAAGNYTIVRTFTATDACGNSSSASQTITVEDTTAPELSIPADYTAECSDELILDDATATDNCGEVTIEVSSEETAGDCDGSYTVTRTFTATDDAGNSSSASQTITVEDTTAPEFTSVPSDYTVECSDDMPMEDATASDNCSEVTITVSSDTTAGDAAGNYTIVRTFTVTDDCGNSTSASQTITVEDTTAPELSIPADYTAECSDELILDDATATDNCGEVTIEVSSETTAGDCDGSYTVTRTFTATDDAGNSSSATQTITVEDTTAPEFTSVPVDYTVECSDEMPMDDATASDNCSDVSITVESETMAGDAAGNYTIVRTFTATDECGNSTSASQTITVEDTTAPELSIPADYTAECSDELILDDATATDNCGEVTIEVSSEETAGDCDGSYTVTRTFTATDDAGNSSSASQTITVEDTTAPEFTSVPSDYTVECSDDMPMEDATASDNCSEVTITVSSDTTAGNAAGNYTIVRTFTVTDDCGNSTSASQTITVEDTTAPELSIPEDYTAECSDELILDDATATDNCGEVTIEVSSEETAGDCAGSYTLTRTFTATDDAGNSSSATQTITVQDMTAPELTIPADYTAECDATLAMEDATASDNCSEVTVTVSSDTTAGNAPGNYTIVRTFTATDDCGNSTSASQTITVEDTTAPELGIPADYTAECSDELILDDATATDNCGEVTIEVSSEETPGDCAGSYTLTRTFTATDDAGNSASATQTITVQDTTAPEFTSVPADYTVGCSDEMPMDDATASDNCSEVSITVESETIAGDAAGNYTIVRTFTATDACGNSSSATQTITVEDTTAPELSIPADYIAECSDALILDDATATDNCGEVTIEVSSEETPGDCAGSYTLTRTFTATDDAGNSASATQAITVQDTTAPEFTSVPADYTVECSDEMPMDDATASDNCSEVSITVESETIAGDAAGNYTIVRTFTATDDCGNSSSASQTITVEDTTAPELSIPADYTAECSDELVLDDATATDNCGEVTIEVSSEETAGDCAGSYTLTRTFTATDDAGNSASATQTITVQDTTAPELTIPADYTAECTETLTLDDATASDNCSEVTITVSEETLAGDCANGYVLVRTFTATDDCGNSSSAAQTITVVDTTGPELFLPPSYEADCGDELLLLDALASDACGLALVTVEETYDYTCDNSYVLTRTFTAVDACFNETIGVQTITVTDTTAPEFTSVPADFSAECSEDLSLDMATATDNCGVVTVTVDTDTLDGGCANTYTLVRTFTATDACGNSTEATQTIEISDTTAPEFTFVPEDQLIECNISLSVTMATAVDNCGDVTLTMDEVLDQGDCGGAYIITRTFTATDECGNSTTAVQTITQQDTTAPTLEIAEDVTVECDEALPAPSHTADDACGAVTVDVTEEIVEGDCPQERTVIRTYTATDDCGNSTSAVQTIHVVDTTAPQFTFTPDATSVVYEADGDTLAEPFVVVLDNCDTEASWSVEETILVDSPNELTVEREYTASDACGNTATYVETTTLVLQVFGCTDDTACNYDEFANEDDGSCFYPLYAYDCDGNCINDVNENGICDELEVAGCTDPDNPGYNPEANIDDGSCLTGGCTIAFACNYDPTAEYQVAGSCEFASCAGCTLEGACNYDEDATLNDGSCTFPDYGYDCNGECLNDTDGDGICDEFEIAGCTDPTNPAYNPSATDEDGSCLVAGCLLPFACNFDPTADYLDVALCDLSSCAGCTDPASCTYDPNATLSAPAACTYPVSQFVDCDGVCNNDVDGDGVCDELEIPGCTNPEASNYSPFATDDNGTCIIEVGGCTLPFACNFDPTADFYLPGSCDFSCLFGMPPGDGNCADELACNYGADEPCVYFDGEGNLCAVVGCTNSNACNFNPDAQISGECEYDSCQVFGCTNANACNYNADANTENGTCDYTACVGCTDSDASNFDPEATVDNGQCTFEVSGCTFLIACNYNPSATVNDGSCDFYGCYGCVTPSACNYDADALYSDGSCTFADNGQDCDGNCLYDSDGDSVCDANEVSGCTDATALNFNPNATDDNGSCTYITGGCTDQTACNFDYTAQEDDGTCEFNTCAGCIVSWACNYNVDATYNDGSCIFPDANGTCPSNCDSDADGDGICDANEIAGCIYSNAINFEPLATDDDGSCNFVGCVLPEYSSYNGLANTNSGDCTNTPRSADFNGDGAVQLADLLEFLVAYGSSGPDWGIDWVQEGCEVAATGIAEMDVDDSGCTYPTAANYDPSAAFDTGSCVWLGCTDATAYNYNNLATLDDSSCQYSLCPDFNGDGQVKATDLLDFLLAWGTVYE